MSRVGAGYDHMAVNHKQYEVNTARVKRPGPTGMYSKTTSKVTENWRQESRTHSRSTICTMAYGCAVYSRQIYDGN